ncbi:MAG: cupin domain-containing protein [Candidatus Aenigmatarchaeota archaeon]
MSPKEPVVLDSESVEIEKVDRGEGVFIQRLIVAEEGAKNCFMRRFTIKPGGSMPLHQHDKTDHVQYVLEGKMKVILGEETHLAKKGNSLYIPAGLKHSYENPFEVDVVFICVVPAGDIKTEIME